MVVLRKTPLSGRRPVATWAIAALALVAILALSALRVRAVDESKCEGAMKLQSDPATAAFKACAGANPIPMNCCIKLAPFVQYAECLQVPKYRQIADSFLAPEVNVSRALRDCLGSN
ncbi:hypothetical protein PLESTB_000382200 [Pleodorina starrii]|uniref:Uncharacterized protein n=1 Tax=Pleodorina starrii TaxID=330485 RepID=A0A9W6BES0_9CHLO|nr:hypothetical protein PLESTM_000012900 [Pleodorina starrii]GLC50465.1 hypothetical protein PLESTB_000382200 [Pleodorina starrii]GLC73299.1 hypothetical protein PLESTF_001357900 [Pleodorina starrii]